MLKTKKRKVQIGLNWRVIRLELTGLENVGGFMNSLNMSLV